MDQLLDGLATPECMTLYKTCVLRTLNWSNPQTRQLRRGVPRVLTKLASQPATLPTYSQESFCEGAGSRAIVQDDRCLYCKELLMVVESVKDSPW